MSQEDKQLLLKVLCAMLPYGVKLDNGLELRSIDVLTKVVSCSGSDRKIDYVRPYLRPLSSMTEEEKTELDKAYDTLFEKIESGMSGFNADAEATAFDVDFYNSHYLDYRGLIERGLAIEAPEGMYEF